MPQPSSRSLSGTGRGPVPFFAQRDTCLVWMQQARGACGRVLSSFTTTTTSAINKLDEKQSRLPLDALACGQHLSNKDSKSRPIAQGPAVSA